MAFSRFSKLFASRSSRAAIIGMIHVPALPGIVLTRNPMYYTLQLAWFT